MHQLTSDFSLGRLGGEPCTCFSENSQMPVFFLRSSGWLLVCVCVAWSRGLVPGGLGLVTVTLLCPESLLPHLFLELHPWGSAVQLVPKKCVEISRLWVYPKNISLCGFIPYLCLFMHLSEVFRGKG